MPTMSGDKGISCSSRSLLYAKRALEKSTKKLPIPSCKSMVMKDSHRDSPIAFHGFLGNSIFCHRINVTLSGFPAPILCLRVSIPVLRALRIEASDVLFRCYPFNAQHQRRCPHVFFAIMRQADHFMVCVLND